MYTVYILRSLKTDRYYVGHTDSITRRIEEHNIGASKYTRNSRPWKLVYNEEFPTRSEAAKRELEIKGKKSKRYIESMIRNWRERPDIKSVYTFARVAIN
jgi:putative endonuclease